MVSFVVCVLMSVKSHGVLRFRALTSHGALRDLFPDVLEVAWCASFSSCPRSPVLLGCLQYPTPSLQAPAIAFCSMGTLSNVFHAADVTLGKGAEAPKLRDVHLAVSPFAKMPPENDGPEMRSARLLAIGKPRADLVRDRWIRSPECYPLRHQANYPFFTLPACPVERRRGGIEPLHARWRGASRLRGRLARAGRRGQAHSELSRRRRRHGGCSGT
jgi:hypothetical protein